MMRGKMLPPTALPPLTPLCLINALQGPKGVGDGERLRDNFQWQNFAIDKRRNVSSPGI